MGDILHPEAHEITGSELAVDGQVEQGQIAQPPSQLKSDPNRPDLLELERWLGPDQASPFQAA